MFGTGHHSAVSARVSPRTTVTVIGDGAVGLCEVLAALRLGAERIILTGAHKDRTAIALSYPTPTRPDARYQGCCADSCRRACSGGVIARVSSAVTRCSSAIASWVTPASPAR